MGLSPGGFRMPNRGSTACKREDKKIVVCKLPTWQRRLHAPGVGMIAQTNGNATVVERVSDLKPAVKAVAAYITLGVARGARSDCSLTIQGVGLGQTCRRDGAGLAASWSGSLARITSRSAGRRSQADRRAERFQRAHRSRDAPHNPGMAWRLSCAKKHYHFLDKNCYLLAHLRCLSVRRAQAGASPEKCYREHE